MQAAGLSAFQTFLVEDVLLTLGNLRAALAWLVEDGTVAPGDRRHAGITRIDRQIELLQVRARAVCAADAPPLDDPAGRRADLGPASPEPAADQLPPSAPTGAGSGLEQLLRDALGSDALSTAPLFRSRRTARD